MVTVWVVSACEMHLTRCCLKTIKDHVKRHGSVLPIAIDTPLCILWIVRKNQVKSSVRLASMSQHYRQSSQKATDYRGRGQRPPYYPSMCTVGWEPPSDQSLMGRKRPQEASQRSDGVGPTNRTNFDYSRQTDSHGFVFKWSYIFCNIVTTKPNNLSNDCC